MTPEEVKLVEDNHNLIYTFIRLNNLELSDNYDLCAIGLCKAAMTYDANYKVKFSVYAFRCMKNELINEWRKQDAVSDATSYDIQTCDGNSVLECLSSLENIEDRCINNILSDDVMSILSEKEKRVLHLYSKGYKKSEIAKIIGVSRQRVTQIFDEIVGNRKIIKALKV